MRIYEISHEDLNSVSEKEQIAAVSNDGNLIYYIENPSESVQLAAVTSDPSAVRHIENPSEQVQLATVKQNGGMLGWIKDPASKQVIMTAILNVYKTNLDLFTDPVYNKNFYMKYRNQYPDWPEWAIIDKSLGNAE